MPADATTRRRRPIAGPRPAPSRCSRPACRPPCRTSRGRTGYWDVGVPPSGAWDDLSIALANLAVGNAGGRAGLEAVVTGPVLRFAERTLVCLAGAATDGDAGRPAGQAGRGDGGAGRRRARRRQLRRARACAVYLAIAGGIDVPRCSAAGRRSCSAASAALDGRALVAGDELPLRPPQNCTAPLDVEPAAAASSDRCGAARDRRAARRAGAPDRGRRRRVLRRDLDRRPPVRPHRRPAGRTAPQWSRSRRRRGRLAPVQRARQRLSGRRRSCSPATPR